MRKSDAKTYEEEGLRDKKYVEERERKRERERERKRKKRDFTTLLFNLKQILCKSSLLFCLF